MTVEETITRSVLMYGNEVCVLRNDEQDLLERRDENVETDDGNKED